MNAEVLEQIMHAYRTMAAEVPYRPEAPSDGPEHQLDLEAEARAYAARWDDEEDYRSFWVGCCNFPTRMATIYAIEAARCMCGASDENALMLLRLAASELERRLAPRQFLHHPFTSYELGAPNRPKPKIPAPGTLPKLPQTIFNMEKRGDTHKE